MPTSTSETNKYIVIAKRKAVKELKAKHLNKTQIQKKLAVSPAFIRKWWENNTIEADHRGWITILPFMRLANMLIDGYHASSVGF